MESNVSAKEILITGDGPIAAFAVGIAKAVGATQVFVTGLVDPLLDICKKMGADHIINVSQASDAELYIRDHTRREGVDVVLEMSGAQPAIDLGFKVVKRCGTFTMFGISSKNKIEFPMNEGVIFKGLRIIGINGRKMFETWYQGRNLIMSGMVDPTPVITHKMSLRDLGKACEMVHEVENRVASKITIDPWS